MVEGIYVPWNDINEFDTLPTGKYQFSVSSEISTSNAGKLMLKNQYKVVGPVEQQGRIHFEYLTLGTEERPMEFVRDSVGASAFKKLAKACQVPQGSLEQMVAGLNTSQFSASVAEIKQPDNASFRPGELINKITQYYRVGEIELGLAPKVGTATGASGAPVAPPMPNAVPAPVQIPPAAPAAPAMPAPPVQPAAPVAPTPAAPPQAAPAPPAPPAAGGQVMRCGICNNDVSVMDFGAHVQRHQTDPSWNGRD